MAFTPTRAPPTCLVLSPPSRRLRRKTSAPEASVPESYGEAPPPASSAKRSRGDGLEASPDAAFASPCSRRLRREASAEEAAVAASPVAALPSPASTRVSDAPAQPVQGRGIGGLRRGRGRGAGVRRQEDAGDWFLAAAELDGSAGVAQGSREVDQVPPAPVRRRGVVSGFGAERTEDALGDQERREREQCVRARVRYDEDVRDRVVHFMSGTDLDRSSGSAWFAGRR